MKIMPGRRKRNYLARFLVFLTTAALVAGMAGCDGCTPSQNLEIRTWHDLDSVRDNLNGSYVLMNDLDSTTAGYEELAGPNGNEGMGWLPIGTEDDVFAGRLDGQGYEIRDLIMYTSGLSYVGVFSFVGERGKIEDIGVGDAEVIGGEVAGCLVAVCYGTLTSCYSAASVYGHDCAGGLVGQNYGTVTDSYCIGTVTGDAVAGGLVGWNQGMVSNSYATGTVIGGFVFVGGLVGANNGTVTCSYSGGNVSGDATESIFVGGLVGGNGDIVGNSYSTGSVTGEGDVGGLVGVNWPEGMVSDSYSTGNVNGEREVGGLVGGNAGTVSDSYSTGNVTGEVDVGGLVGTSHGAVSSSFWDIETGGQATSDGGTGKTTMEMQDVATFRDAGWRIIIVGDLDTRDTAYFWNIVDGESYPFLSWGPIS